MDYYSKREGGKRVALVTIEGRVCQFFAVVKTWENPHVPSQFISTTLRGQWVGKGWTEGESRRSLEQRIHQALLGELRGGTLPNVLNDWSFLLETDHESAINELKVKLLDKGEFLLHVDADASAC